MKLTRGLLTILAATLLAFPALAPAATAAEPSPDIVFPEGDGWFSFITEWDGADTVYATVRFVGDADFVAGAYRYSPEHPEGRSMNGNAPFDSNFVGSHESYGNWVRANVEPLDPIAYEGEAAEPNPGEYSFTFRGSRSPTGFLVYAAGNITFTEFQITGGHVTHWIHGEDAAYVTKRELDDPSNPPMLDIRSESQGDYGLRKPWTTSLTASGPFVAQFAATTVVEPDGNRNDNASWYVPWNNSRHSSFFGLYEQTTSSPVGRAGTYTLEFDGTESGSLAYWIVEPKLITHHGIWP